MLKRILRLPYYFSILLCLFFITLIVIIFYTKGQSFLILNQFHTFWLDTFFKVITHLGDGLASVILIIILRLFRKKKKAAACFLAFISSGLVAQILKRTFHLPRPKVFIEQSSFKYEHFVEGVNLYSSNSFPSGHTTSAFAIATILVLVFKKKRISIQCITIAALVGYSRIYLAQHFLPDVVFGAFIGTVFALLSYYWVYDRRIVKSLKLRKSAKLRRLRYNNIPAVTA